MRLLLAVLVLILVISYAAFMLENLDTVVPVVILWTTPHEGIHIGIVVLLSLLVGVVFTAVIAVAEGAKIRLENRRLRRDMRALETEINYLRTQPSTSPRPEPDSIESSARPLPPATGGGDPGPPPSAPVYEPDDQWEDDSDDDAYSGGRAV